jgi:hypothetical protein
MRKHRTNGEEGISLENKKKQKRKRKQSASLPPPTPSVAASLGKSFFPCFAKLITLLL